MVKVILLAGGFGTRLKEETEFRPKPMVHIANKPIIWHIMKNYSHYGYNEFIIAGGYKIEMIKEYFLNYYNMNNDFTVDLSNNKITLITKGLDPFKVTVVDTGINTMTGGRIKRLQKLIGNERFMVTYGDGVGDVNIKELMEFHIKNKKIGTVTGVRPSSRWGELDIDGNTVTNFQEKPQVKNAFINGGFFVFEPEVLDYIKDDSIMLEREPLVKLAEDKELAIYKHKGFWKAMDTFKDMETLQKLWDNGEAKWKIW